METIIQHVHPGGTVSARRVVALFAALALVLGGVALATETRADAAPAAAVSADSGAVASVGSAAQIDVGALIRAIVCPILARLAAGPFGPLIGNVIATLRARFGCASP